MFLEKFPYRVKFYTKPFFITEKIYKTQQKRKGSADPEGSKGTFDASSVDKGLTFLRIDVPMGLRAMDSLSVNHDKVIVTVLHLCHHGCMTKRQSPFYREELWRRRIAGFS